MIVVHFAFTSTGPWGEEMSQELEGLAQDIAATPGLIWKIWTENHAERRAGGIYLFKDQASADAYVAMHTERVGSFGATELQVDSYTVNQPLSLIDRSFLG